MTIKDNDAIYVSAIPAPIRLLKFMKKSKDRKKGWPHLAEADQKGSRGVWSGLPPLFQRFPCVT